MILGLTSYTTLPEFNKSIITFVETEQGVLIGPLISPIILIGPADSIVTNLFIVILLI